jgi:transposase
LVDDLILYNQTEIVMPKSRPPYPAAFRQQIVELARNGRPVADLAREFEPSAQTIHTWIKQADRDQGKRADILSTSERDELRRLRKQIRQLQQEREILAKAAAWFARETDSLPSGS